MPIRILIKSGLKLIASSSQRAYKSETRLPLTPRLMKMRLELRGQFEAELAGNDKSVAVS